MKNKPYPFYQWDQAENIWTMLALAAKKYGDSDAYVFKKGKDTHSKSFAQFHREAHALAAYFINEGYKREKIAILGENSYEWILAWFGIVLSGNIAVPIDKLLQPEQIAFILGDTRASAIVYSKQCAEMVPSSIKGLRMEELSSFMVQGATVPDLTDKDDTCLIIYTSGTTGIGKGVPLTQDNLCFDTQALSMIAEFKGRNLFVLPLYHVFAFQGVLVFLLEGQTTCISAGLKRIAKEMEEYKPYDYAMVPLFVETMYAKVMDNARQQGKEKQLKFLMKVSLALYAVGIDIRRKLFKTVLDAFGGNLTNIMCGGAPLDKMYTKAFRAFGINIMIGYGITECAPVITGNRNHYYRDGSVGQPLPGAQFRTDAPDGKSEGELYVKGRMVMHGYYNNDEATREAFDGGWFKTGDYGYIDRDGFIFLTGRKKNIIILSNGKNLYPEELELQLMKEPAICEVVVYEDNRQVAAEIFPDYDWLMENGVKRVREHLEMVVEHFNKQLPPYKTITKIKLRDVGFPKTSTQKIKRQTKEAASA